jgi:hypothetical protein
MHCRGTLSMKTPFVQTEVDWLYCSPKAPYFNDSLRAIVIGAILSLILKEKELT